MHIPEHSIDGFAIAPRDDIHGNIIFPSLLGRLPKEVPSDHIEGVFVVGTWFDKIRPEVIRDWHTHILEGDYKGI